jgi:hypothetical protein
VARAHERVRSECDRFGELLGDDHDLATLAELLSSRGEDPAPPSVDIDRILDRIVARRAELTPEALEHGRRVYADNPKAFKRRLGA